MKGTFNIRKDTLLYAGLLFISAGILLNEWVLAALFSSDGTIATSHRIIIWLVNLFLISIGLILIIYRKTLTKEKINILAGLLLISAGIILNERYLSVLLSMHMNSATKLIISFIDLCLISSGLILLIYRFLMEIMVRYRRSGTNKNYLINASLVVASMLFCLLVTETALRIRHYIFYLKVTVRDKCFTYSPDLIYKYIPGKCTNSHGYRDNEYSYEKPNGFFRIVIIGDSIAEGEYVQQHESFGKMIEKKLNVMPAIRKFEVIVLAVSGYSTSQELKILEDDAFKYEPDLILWSYCLNDPAHPIYHNANGEYGRYFFRPKLYLSHFFERRKFFFNEKIKGRDCDKEYHKYLHCVYWDQVVSHIQQIGKVSKEKNIPIIFLIHPVFEENKSFHEYSLTLLHLKLRDVASKAGLKTIDLLDAFKFYLPDDIKMPGTEDWYDPWHPNELGHKITAEYIYNEIHPQVLNP